MCLIRLLRDERGASAAEYALLLALIGAGLAFATMALGDSVSGAMNDSSTCIQQRGKSCGKGNAPQNPGNGNGQSNGNGQGQGNNNGNGQGNGNGNGKGKP